MCKDYNSKFVFLSQCIVFPKSPFKISVSWSLPFQFVSESGNKPERMITQTSLKLCRWKTVCCQSTRNSFAAWTISWPGEGVSDDDENNSTGHLHDCFHFRVGQCRGNLSTLYDVIFSVELEMRRIFIILETSPTWSVVDRTLPFIWK